MGPTTQYGEVGFDLSETWSEAAGTYGNDFFAVAVHEIGHAIGLSHADDAQSIMYPYLGAQTGLSAGDIQAIEQLYGPAQVNLQRTGDFAGGAGDDVFAGSVDGDLILGGGGDDELSGGFGNDQLSGDGGNDLLFGNQGADVISAHDGNDTIYGGQNNDLTYGGFGDDQLFGNLEDYTLFGNQGADFLHGGQGRDSVYGGQGDDVLIGGLGDDFLEGGLGADTFVFAPAQGNDLLVDLRFEEGDRLNLQGHDYTLGQNNEDQAVIFLDGGGTIVLIGLTPDDLQGGLIA